MDTKACWRECDVAVGYISGESRNRNARRSDCGWSLDRAANRSTACSRMAGPSQHNAEMAGCIVDPSRCRRHKRRHHPTRCVGSFPAPRRSVSGIEMYGSNATTRCVNPLRDAEWEQSGVSEGGTKAELAPLRCQAVKIRRLFCSIEDPAGVDARQPGSAARVRKVLHVLRQASAGENGPSHAALVGDLLLTVNGRCTESMLLALNLTSNPPGLECRMPSAELQIRKTS